MSTRVIHALGLTLVAVALLAIPAEAQDRVNGVRRPDGATDRGPGFRPTVPVPVTPAPPTAEPAITWKEDWMCSASGPEDVSGFRVRCTNATVLDFYIADCCVPGDHWQLKGKAWDVNPNTAVTTSPGPANIFGVGGRIYNYGGTPVIPGNLDAYVECSYLHGVNMFGAGSFIQFQSDGPCVVTPDPAVPRIDRTP